MWLKHRVKIRLASQVTGMSREGIDCIPSGRERHDEICLLTDSLTTGSVPCSGCESYLPTTSAQMADV